MIRLTPNASALIAIAAVALSAAQASAQPRDMNEATTSIVIHNADVHPHSRRAAKASLERIDEAAMEACGASPFSLREYRSSVRASSCWRDAMDATLAKIGDERLFDAYVHDLKGGRLLMGDR